MRRIYIHDDPAWPNMHWQEERIADRLTALKYRQGWLRGRMEALGFELRMDAHLDTLTEEAVRSSAIEGEVLDTEQVRSSVARRLGMEAGGISAVDRHVDGVVEMTLDATQGYDRPLTPDRLFGWQAGLFPSGRNRLGAINVGEWRDDSRGPMQVVSGPIGRERVHFEAPSADRVSQEMSAFLEWFNSPASVDGVLRAALAHLWFVTIHPFEDGNGRRRAGSSRTWPWRAPNTAHSASTACPPRYCGAAGPHTTGSWSGLSTAVWMSPAGWRGSWIAWERPLPTPRPPWQWCLARHDSGRTTPACRSTRDSAGSSTGCWTDTTAG